MSYLQDNLGNRSQINDNGSVQGFSRSPSYRNQYVAGPGGGVSNGSEHEVADYEGLNYTYFGDRKLASVTGNGNSYDLRYDAFGRCVKRTLNGTTIYYTYDGPHPIYEWKADGSKAGWNLYGQNIDEILLRADYQVLPNGQGYFFQQNKLGSVTHLTGFSGEVIESYRYDAFGQPTTTYTGGSFNNRFRFTGREYQPAFGIYEYRNRAYHPGLGRFLSEDATGFAAGDTNLFRYCGGDPVNRTDPFGLTPAGKSSEKIYENEGIDSGGDSSEISGTFVDYGQDSFLDRVMQEVFGSGSNSGGAGSVTSSGAGGVSIGGAGNSPLGGGDKSGPSGPAVGGNGLFGTITNVVIGANRGEAWRTVFTEPWVPGPTGGYLPTNIARGMTQIRSMVPSSVSANGFHAWHAGSNAYLAQQLGLIGMPAIIVGGLIHESPLDWNSFISEQQSQGTINHVLDSATDIAANVFGMTVGYLQQGPAGVNTAITYGNYIPGPADFGENNKYDGNPAKAWGPYW